MMSRFQPLRLPSALTILIVAGTLLISLVLGPIVYLGQIGLQELVVVVLAALVASLVFAPSERVLKFGFWVWIASFGFGWRTVHVTTALNFHPAEVLAWLLFIVLIARSIVRRDHLDFSIPAPILLIMPFVLMGMLIGVYMVIANIDQIVQEAKIFLVLVPSYYVVKWLVRTRADWERAILLSVIVAAYVSALGFLDYFLPGLSQSLAGSSANTLYVTEEQGFGRVGFILYGSFSAGFLIFTFFGMSVHYFIHSLKGSDATRIVTGGIVLIELIAMYFSGYRGVWAAIAAFLVIYAFVQRRAWFLPAAIVAILPFMPSQFLERLQSLFNSSFADSSQVQHFSRAAFALDFVNRYPLFGAGFGATGYVHADLIQIAGDLGIPALLVFLSLVFGMIWKTWRLAQRPTWFGEYAGALFATICGLLVVLSGEGLIVWIQLMVPVWFVFAMSDKLAELASKESAPLANAALAVSTPAITRTPAFED